MSWVNISRGKVGRAEELPTGSGILMAGNLMDNRRCLGDDGLRVRYGRIWLVKSNVIEDHFWGLPYFILWICFFFPLVHPDSKKFRRTKHLQVFHTRGWNPWPVAHIWVGFGVLFCINICCLMFDRMSFE